MRILGIETSCDETSVAVVEDGRCVRSNVIASSKAAFEKIAGVIPEEAARRQVKCMIPVLQEALGAGNMTLTDIDAIAVTRGPGLLGSLIVGTTTARILASITRKPIIGVHHTLGHLSSTWLFPGAEGKTADAAMQRCAESAEPAFPILALSVSGGHTDLWLRASHTHGCLLGRTRDDAAGEAFDKGASLLGLPYPGGPALAREAIRGNERTFTFPLPLANDPTLDFSFSGLKTSLKYLLRDLGTQASVPDIAASFQWAICTHLIDRLGRAIKQHHDTHEMHIVGGVSANERLRELAAALCLQHGMILRTPAALAYCTDNAAMIAAAGFFLWQELGNEACSRFATQASLPLS
ncbi:MAG: O-sialoglycoprotein endopeptidase [Candidatus Peregrinibacteria bacterium Greene0416_19]|nr:MAG: O-sialoglycoprotein endopeptidase [Candidatus Peregrinibacteria bacterium Greene0416_19]